MRNSPAVARGRAIVAGDDLAYQGCGPAKHSKAPPDQEALSTAGVGCAEESGGLLQERSSNDAQMMLMNKITKRNMAGRINEWS